MARKQSKARSRRQARAKRHARVLKKVRGTPERPRLVVHRSLRNMEGQIVDDDHGVTLLGLSTMVVDDAADLEETKDMTPKVAASYTAGKKLAEKAREDGIERIVFDRGGYRYHGRVRAFAEGARAGGLDF